MKAEVFRKRKQLLLRVPTSKTEYRFRLKADNGEVIAQSEGYTAKHNVLDVLDDYFPEFQVVDLTGEE